MLATSPLESRILEFRGLKVMIDADLAELYGVTTKRLNEQVRRNIERFPKDFMFQLSTVRLENCVASPSPFKGEDRRGMG